MRVPEGFTLAAIADLPGHLAPAAVMTPEAPESPWRDRRFLFLDEPGHSGPESLVLLGAGTRLETIASLQAGLVLAEESVAGIPEHIPVIRVRDARKTLAALLRALSGKIGRDTPFTHGAGNTIHPTAVVEGVLEGGVIVEAGVFIGAGSFVGAGTRLEANAVVREHCVIGRGTVIQSGAVIGCAGFGFFSGGAEQMPHPAGARIGALCFIGANTVIAAGVLHPTEIGDGCKLDSHVQIAHNVVLGDGAMLASQSGVAGSTTIGEGFRMGGAASVAGHLRIGRNVSVAAKSGVTKDVPDGATVAGFPARPIGEWRRNVIKMRNEK